MSFKSYARVILFSLVYFVWSCGGGESSTGPGTDVPSVQLFANTTSMTLLGPITLTATTSGGADAASRVEFYEKTVGSDAAATLIEADSIAPFAVDRWVTSTFDNGTKEFTATAYAGTSRLATSEAIRVVINIIPDNITLAAEFYYVNRRITTPGTLRFMVQPNKPITRIEVYNGTTKVAEDAAPTPPYLIAAPVTAADNGARTYMVKAYDAKGTSVESRTIPTVVDIKWNLIENVASFRSTYDHRNFVATDATNAVYYAGTTDAFNLFLVKHDADGRELWSRNFGGPDFEYASSLALDASGRIYLAGVLWFPGPVINTQCFVNIYDATGGLVESRQIKHPVSGRSISCVVRPDESGNLYVSGHTTGNITTGWWFLTKYDRDGNVVWTQEVAGTPVPGSQFHGGELDDILVGGDGGIYVAGSTNDTFDGAPNRGPRDVFVLKLDSDGNRLWANQYGNPGVLAFSSRLTPDPNGGVYLAGWTDTPNYQAGQQNALIASYGADGTRRWVKTIDGGWTDIAHSVAADSRGAYLVGRTYGAIDAQHQTIIEPSQGTADRASQDLFVAKYSLTGDLVEVRLLGTPADDIGDDIVIGVNGEIYVAGGTFAGESGTPFLARYRDAP